MNKFIAILIFLTIFSLSAFAQKGDEVELVINGVKNGTTYSETVRKFGKPLRTSNQQTNECAGGFSKTIYYNGLEITLDSDENGKNWTASAITVTSGKWTTDKGIKLGSSLATVKAKYGKAIVSNEDGATVLNYEMKRGPGGVSFYFRNNRLVKIELIPTQC